MKWLDPERDDAWQLTRISWALTLLVNWILRLGWLREAFTSEGVIIASGRVPVPNWIIFTPATCYAIWGVIVLSLLVVLRGRWVRPALAVYIVLTWTLFFTEGMHFRAYDRLSTWQALVLMFAPCTTSTKDTSGSLSRYAMMIVYCGIYGSTGLYKLLDEPGWFDGTAMAYHLCDDDFGGRPLGVWLSQFSIVCLVMCWWTLIFETLFPVFVWIRWTNPWWLLLGAVLHMGIFFTLNVFTFSPIALCVYPILLHPDAYRSLKRRLLATIQRYQRARRSPDLDGSPQSPPAPPP